MPTAPDLVLLGNLLVDDVVFADGRTRMAQAGGAMLYTSLAASLWGVSIGCVSLAGSDYPATALATLRSRGVALDGVHALAGNGVRTWLLYEGGVRRVVHRLGCPTHEAVSPLPEHVPEAWHRARAFHLAPMPIAIQRALVTAIRRWESPAAPAFVALDPHLPVTPDTLQEWRELLAQVDVFLPSDDEWRLPADAFDAACGALAGGRLRFVAWKRGVAGGRLYDLRGERQLSWSPRPAEAVDPTGAGDGFAAGFITAHLEGAGPETALKRAVVTAGVACGGWGADGLLAGTRAAAEARIAAWDTAGAPA